MSKIEVIKYYANLFKITLKRFKFNIKNFGITIAFLNIISDFTWFYLIQNYKISVWIREKQGKQTMKLLTKKYSDLIEEYKNKTMPPKENSKKIWCFWAQGIENAPQVVKNCINSIEKNKGNYELIILTKDNYADYVELPQKIIDKMKNGKITLTHFSDILRSKLLSTYGGVWVDSTMYFCEEIFDKFDDVIFNTRYAKHVKWSIYFMGGKPNKLFSFVSDFLNRYYCDYDEIINYFLMDLVIHIAYETFEDCREYIDNANIEHPNVVYFIDKFSETFNQKEFDEVCEKYKFFKLSYKNSKNSKKYDKNGNLTYYGYFTNEIYD